MKIIKHSHIGAIAHYLAQLIVKTLRVKWHLHPNIDPKKSYAYGFWHGKQFAPIMLMPNFGESEIACLVSASRDGEILSAWLKRLGYHIVRGSSSKKAIASVVKLLAAAKQGYSVGIAADGPRGPRLQAKAGLAFLAYKAGMEVIPFGVSYSKKIQFNKAWDKYQFPLPFAKVIFYLGEPIKINDLEDVEQVSVLITNALNEAEANAEQILKASQLKLSTTDKSVKSQI